MIKPSRVYKRFGLKAMSFMLMIISARMQPFRRLPATPEVPYVNVDIGGKTYRRPDDLPSGDRTRGFSWQGLGDVQVFKRYRNEFCRGMEELRDLGIFTSESYCFGNLMLMLPNDPEGALEPRLLNWNSDIFRSSGGI